MEAKRLKLSPPETANKNDDGGSSFFTKLNRIFRNPPRTTISPFAQTCRSLFEKDIVQDHFHADSVRLRKYSVIRYSQLKQLIEENLEKCELIVADNYYLVIRTGDAYVPDIAREERQKERMAMEVSSTVVPPSIDSIAKVVPVYDHIRWNDMVIWLAKVLPLSASFIPVCEKSQCRQAARSDPGRCLQQSAADEG
jgi:hypothetical protein